MSAPASSAPLYYRVTPEGVLIFLRVTPNAGRNTIEGVETRDDTTTVLRVRVAAVPDKGKANAAVLALLAKAIGVSKSSLSLASGDTSRHKTVLVKGEASALAMKLAGLAGA